MKGKRFLASILFSTVATCENPLFAQVSSPVTKVVDGTSYTYTSKIFTSAQDANFISGSGPTKQNQQLASKLAIAFEDDLGLKNGIGATFFWEYSGFSNFFSVAGTAWDGSQNQAITVGAATLLRNNQDLAAIFVSSAPAPQSLPIEITGNVNGGSGINLTTNLAPPGTKLEPKFKGGTLTIDQDVVTQNFTVDDSPTNAIDLNGGIVRLFTGSISDEAPGKPGSFKVVASPGGSLQGLVFDGRNTYTGTLTVGPNAEVAIGSNGSLSEKSNITLEGQGGVVFNPLNTTVNSVMSEEGSIIRILNGSNLTIGGNGGNSRILGTISNFDGNNKLPGGGSLTKIGLGTAYLYNNNTYTGTTEVREGTLYLEGGSITSNTTVQKGATLAGTGIINGEVINTGKVAPGGSDQIGTLTVNGNYGQLSPGVLEIQVNGSSSDRLALKGDNRFILLGGELNITSLAGAAITAGKTYTAITTPVGTQGGEFGLNTTFGVVGASGYTFVRETDPRFSELDGGKAQACDPKNPELCTDLRFGWLQATPTSTPTTPTTVTTVPTTVTPGVQTIKTIKETGGAITTAITGNIQTNTDVCAANTGNSVSCNKVNQPGTGSGASNPNNIATAKVIDAGNTSVQAAVTTGVTGGQPVLTPSGTPTGYTTNQTKAALVTPDFVNVAAALFAVPTRAELNAALHQLTAEPYASMQSVALEALEQFRANTLALTTGQRLPFIVEEQVCETSGDPAITTAPTAQPNNAKQTCTPVTRQKLTPWSLLIDGSNTQATLNGTNDLASLDYNIFSSSYGLQYDFNPNWSAGAAFGYGRANLYNYEYSNTRIDSDTYSGAVWGIYRPSDAWKLTALAGYMNLQYSSDRNISFGGLNRNATANWTGNGFTSALAAEYDWILSNDKTSRSAVRIKPRSFFSYALHNQGAFSESGANSLNLAVNSHTADSLIYGIGFTIETPIVTGKTSRLIPRLYLGYEYDFNGDTNEEHQLTASFDDVPALGSIDVLGQNRGANAVDVALSLEYETSDTLSLYGNVGGAFWGNGNELNYGAGLRLRW